jgi:predicted P-loop ATPase
MSQLRGKWLHEFQEMGSLIRTEEKRQKSFLSRKVDEFRPSYGRREIRCPRQLAFAGSTNEHQWNKDPTGGRRFWPVKVEADINIDGLRAARDQLFAEAYALAMKGERYWPTADEQRELFDPEQLDREQPEAFVSLLHKWLDDDPTVPEFFPLVLAMTAGLKIEPKAITRDITTRTGIALAKLGCEKVEKRNHPDRFLYKRPTRNAASSADQGGVRTGTFDDPDEGVPF